MKAPAAPQGRIRIIAGEWRGRKLKVSNDPLLRPTPDRVRETLFNWLQQQVQGKKCLDLFAGSGALGFEALSRGADSVTMVENNRESVAVLLDQAALLGAENLSVLNEDAESFLHRNQEKFDIVFLDPPFSEKLLAHTCETLVKQAQLKPAALVYLESDTEISVQLPYTTLKTSCAGKVQFALVRFDLGRNQP